MKKGNKNQSALRSRNKLLAGIVSALMLIVIAGSVVLGVGFGVYGKDTSKWFKPAEQEEVQDPDVVDPEQKEDSSLIVNADESDGISLLMSNATVASDGTTSQDITASLSSGASIQRVSWSVTFKNSVSEWATGKNVADYVTIKSIDNLSATITCLQPFGEQIIITASAVDGGGAKATATVDYIKRVEEVWYVLNSVSSKEMSESNPGEIYFSCSKEKHKNEFSIEAEYSIGTLMPEIVIDYEDSAFICGNDRYNVWENITYHMEQTPYSFTNYPDPFADCYFDLEKLLTTGIADVYSFLKPEILSDDSDDTLHEVQDIDIYVLRPAMYSQAQLDARDQELELELSIDVVYGDLIIQQEWYTSAYPLGFNICGDILQQATSASVSTPSVVF